MNQLQAMKDQKIRIRLVDVDVMEVTFDNGLVLPIEMFTDENDVQSEDPVNGGWAHFGNDEAGYGRYPVKLITEEEWQAEQKRLAR